MYNLVLLLVKNSDSITWNLDHVNIWSRINNYGKSCGCMVVDWWSLYSKFLALMLAEKEAGIEIVPVFISVDPERDTVEQVREYVKGDS